MMLIFGYKGDRTTQFYVNWRNESMLAQKKVELLRNDNVNEYYEVFLNNQTENTMKAYRTALKLFSEQMFGKEMKFVTISELEKVKMIEIMGFYQWLNDDVIVKGVSKKRYMTNTVNKHINGIKSFFRFLSKEYETISDKIFDNIDLKNPELDAKSWDGLDWTEAIDIWEYAQDNFGKDSSQLSMLFKLASVTSIRLEALLSLRWSVHWFKKNEHGIEVNYIDVIDKGKRHKKPVSKEFYKELKNNLPTDMLFCSLNKNKVGDALKDTLKALSFDSRRNIKFHSFKKAGVMRALEMSDNMYKAKEQGNHSSMTTAEKYYLKYKESLISMTSYSMDSSVDVQDEISSYSKEELIEAISKMREVSKVELMNILKSSQ